MTAGERTVLIVDDREENRYTTQHALKRAGFRTLEAGTGQQALEMATLGPDVIVLDVRLPDMLGYEVCRRLRAHPRTAHIPVLQLSAAFLNTESKLYALESGADAYLTQPADPLVLVATVRSLVRLHDAERDARNVAAQWSATFDSLSEGVAILHEDHIERCNRAMTELLGVSYGTVEQTRYPDLLRRCFGIGPEQLASARVFDVQRESRFFQLRLTDFAENEVSRGRIFLVADVTRQKHAEQALLLNERLAATGRMANTIAHEINNPLEAITNLIYLSQRSPGLPSEAHDYLAAAAVEVQRVSQITRQVLSFNRETSAPVAVPIAALVEDVLALSDRAAVERNIRVVAQLDRTLVINGYPARLRQAFSNIVRNAIEASARGSLILVRIGPGRLYPDGAGNPVPAARITVADQGSGILPEHRARIFEAFFTTKDQKGSGIGLWLTATIIGEHAGKLQVRSCTRTPHSGTTISVLLPVQLRPAITTPRKRGSR